MSEPHYHDRAARGAEAERAAERWLQAQGLRTLARNYRCRRGEIDLIMLDSDCVVFVEIRLRSRSDFGGADGSVDARKQRRIALAAQHFLLSEPRWQSAPCRFDVLATRRADAWQWLRNAFHLHD